MWDRFLQVLLFPLPVIPQTASHAEKTCPSTALSTTNPTRLDPSSNPAHRSLKPIRILNRPPDDDDECGAICGVIGRGNRSALRNPSPVPLFLAHIPHDLTRYRTWGTAVGNQRLTVQATARPWIYVTNIVVGRVSKGWGRCFVTQRSD
jgi:hypothetical protein